MRKVTTFLFIIFLVAFSYVKAENLTIYTGTTTNKTQFLGASLSGDIWHFLQLQFDIFKYLKQDQDLYSPNPEENRGDFLGVSVNFSLKFPLHLLPYLDKLDYVQPFILIGYGYGAENLSGEYTALPDKDEKTGFFSKLRQYDSFGFGLIVMVAPQVGLKADYRSIRISEHKGMELPSRKFNRLSFGICIGPYKEKIRKIK